MERQTGGIVLVPHQQPFPAQMHAVGGAGQDGIRFPASADIIILAFVFHVSGIVQIQPVFPAEGRSGVDAVQVIGLVRAEHHGALLPGQQVPGFVMTPEFQPAGSVKGMVLVENMVLAPEVTKAVWVVQPADRGSQMEAGPPAVLWFAGSFGFSGQSFQILSQHVHFVAS